MLVAAKTVAENKKRMDILLVSDFVHVILYGEDFVGRINFEHLRKNVNERISCDRKELHILFIYILVSEKRGEKGMNIVHACS